MTDTEYAKAIQMKATVANLEMNAALTIEQQAQIGQDFIADIAELSERGTGSETRLQVLGKRGR
ncbi:hypothetical protein [Lactiplantibacillus plantarum]|uniref:hypothetical protein n=1 Tax=Lactiplantibacillus plantarum TaxID=1590 RepID=UPI00280B0737|nr:hypothetical protein [Lactiplantibacillus plantarum]